jgi:hypothetical protein
MTAVDRILAQMMTRVTKGGKISILEICISAANHATIGRQTSILNDTTTFVIGCQRAKRSMETGTQN